VRRALLVCAAFSIVSGPLLAELSPAEIEEAADAGRRAALLAIQGAPGPGFTEALATDSIVAGRVGTDVWRQLSERQRVRLRAIVAERFAEALPARRGTKAEITWSAARARGEKVQLSLGLRYPEGVLNTRWSLARAPSGWLVEDVFLVDPGVSLAEDATRGFHPAAIRPRDRARAARSAALPRIAGLAAIAAIVLVLAPRLAPRSRRILYATALAPAVLFALDGFFAVRRIVSEPFQLADVAPPDPWRPIERQALAFERAGRLDDARRAWEHAISAGAPAAPADYRFGVALRAAGRTSDARVVFERALSRSPGAPGAWKELGLLALAEGRSAEARDLLQRYLTVAGPDPDALSALAVAAANVGDRKEAISAVEEAGALSPDGSRGARLQSEIYARAGDAARVVGTLRPLVDEGVLDRETLRSDPAYLPIATDPVWVSFLSETPAPARTPGR
jgi:tetratricopeptide (TPR) repeat protein